MATNNVLSNKTPENFTVNSEEIDPKAASDSYVQYNINSVAKWRIGVDNTDDDFKISSGNALGVNDYWDMDTAGHLLMVKQPAFLATHTIAQNNITGVYPTWATINFTTEVFDQNLDYDGTNRFVAPIAGKYHFSYSIQIGGLLGTEGQWDSGLTTSGGVNRGYGGSILFPTPLQVVATRTMTASGEVDANMDAGDIAYIQNVVQGLLANTVDAPANATDTWFCGFLMC